VLAEGAVINYSLICKSYCDMENQAFLTKSELLQDIVRLNTSSIEQLKMDLETILEQRKKNMLQKKEQNLVATIYQYTESEAYEKYKKLADKLRTDTIDDAEQQELLRLTPQVEAGNAARLEHLRTLANIRKMPLRALMIELGLIVEEGEDE
jgi:hypothetical protein